MLRRLRTPVLRRYLLQCIIVIIAFHILVLLYILFGSSRLFKTSFGGILSYRLFPNRQCYNLNFTLKAYNFDNNTTWEMLEKEIACNLEPGGRYKPETYIAQNDIVLVIPYRNREEQLKTFMRYMHPYLQLKELAYRIVVVEMTPGVDFNRGLLLNIGFVETIKVTDQQCFIFHDVDLLPENISTSYDCERSPLHMAVAIDKNKYTLPYQSYFGGICAMKKEHFQMINGFSNQYFGWGGEDDDFHVRLKLSNLTIRRLPKNEGRYHMLSHAAEKPNPEKMDLLKSMRARRSVDGLNSLKYRIVKNELKPLYTWILVDVNESDVKAFDQEQLKIIKEELAKSNNSKNYSLQRKSRPYHYSVTKRVTSV